MNSLSDQAKDFLNDPTRNIITRHTTELSKIFDWFQGDFTKKTSLVDYIKSYNVDILADNAIQFLEYDWNLNDIRK